MGSIEEIIDIPELKIRLEEAVKAGHKDAILDEVILQSKVEFNYEEIEEAEEDEELEATNG